MERHADHAQQEYGQLDPAQSALVARVGQLEQQQTAQPDLWWPGEWWRTVDEMSRQHTNKTNSTDFNKMYIVGSYSILNQYRYVTNTNLTFIIEDTKKHIFGIKYFITYR